MLLSSKARAPYRKAAIHNRMMYLVVLIAFITFVQQKVISTNVRSHAPLVSCVVLRVMPFWQVTSDKRL